MRQQAAKGFVDTKRQIAIRLPKALFETVERLAMTNGRSFNEQVTVLLDAAMKK